MPTPMAKTVFGLKYNFRLATDGISYMQFDELVERMKRDAQTKYLHIILRSQR